MGFLPKDASAKTLQFAVSEITAGRRYIPAEYVNVEEAGGEDDLFKTTPELSILTPQQVNILKLICAGKPNKQIAYELSLAEATVKAHITALLRRLDVRNRTQAVVFVESVMARHAEPEARAFCSTRRGRVKPAPPEFVMIGESRAADPASAVAEAAKGLAGKGLCFVFAVLPDSLDVQETSAILSEAFGACRSSGAVRRGRSPPTGMTTRRCC